VEEIEDIEEVPSLILRAAALPPVENTNPSSPYSYSPTVNALRAAVIRK